MLPKYFKITDSPEKLKVRYRQLALLNHPDKGGSTEKMQEINREYDFVTKHRFKKSFYEFDDEGVDIASSYFDNMSKDDFIKSTFQVGAVILISALIIRLFFRR